MRILEGFAAAMWWVNIAAYSAVGATCGAVGIASGDWRLTVAGVAFSVGLFVVGRMARTSARRRVADWSR
jgi:hypothetical protein